MPAGYLAFIIGVNPLFIDAPILISCSTYDYFYKYTFKIKYILAHAYFFQNLILNKLFLIEMRHEQRGWGELNDKICFSRKERSPSPVAEYERSIQIL